MTSRWHALTAAAGVALLAAAVGSLGVATTMAQLRTLAPILPLLVLLAAVRYPLQAAAWRVAMPAPNDLGLMRLTIACLIGETAGYLTFAGPFASVPARGLLIRDRLAVRDGMMAGALERVCFTMTAAAMVAVAAMIIAARQSRKAGTWSSLALVLAASFTALAGIVFVSALVVRASRRWLPPLPARRRALAALLGLAAGQHLLSFLEAWLMLHVLGWQPDLRRLFLFEALMKLVNALSAFVPAGIGVFETGSALLAAAVRLGAATGLALGLARRVRGLILSGAGLLLFALWRTDRARWPG